MGCGRLSWCGAGIKTRIGGGLRCLVPMPALFPGLRTQEELQTARTELKEAQVKLIQQESALNELSNRGEGGTGRQPLISHHAGHPT